MLKMNCTLLLSTVLILGTTACGAEEDFNPHQAPPPPPPPPVTANAATAAEVMQACTDHLHTVAANAARSFGDVAPRYYTIEGTEFTSAVEESVLPNNAYEDVVHDVDLTVTYGYRDGTTRTQAERCRVKAINGLIEVRPIR